MKNLKKSKLFPLYVIILVFILIIFIVIIKNVVLGNTIGKYGNRLKGINKITFNKESKSKIIDSLNANDKVSNTKIIVKGKIINVIFNISDDVSVDDAKKIASSSLASFSDDVKKFYDIQIFVVKPTEKGTTKDVAESDGTTTTSVVKEFPIIGYKNSSSNDLVW